MELINGIYYPSNDKPIMYTLIVTEIVTEPISLHRWATSLELAEQKAQEYRDKGYTVHIEKGAK